jgi:hypothetical protein
MKRVKTLFVFSVVLITVLASCPNPAGSGSHNNNNNNEDGEKTIVVFNNTQGICAVTVYDDYRRRDEDKIAEVPAGRSSEEIEWTPNDSYPFYFEYQITLKGISDITINYVPETGKDQTAARIEANKKNEIIIPGIDEAVSSPDEHLTVSSYILIQNIGSYPFTLYRGSSPIGPENAGSPLVGAGEKALYKINPGPVSLYTLLVGANDILFPASIANFEAGYLYRFYFNGGALAPVSDTEIVLANLDSSAANNTLPETPAAPVIIPGDGMFTVSWSAAANAQNYGVYISDTAAPPAAPEKTVPGTSTVLTGLTNKTAYSVWIKAINSAGSSDFSPAEKAKPWPSREIPETPSTPKVIPGINRLTITWEKSGGASSYNVYVDTSPSQPSTPAVTTRETSAVKSDLENGKL